MTREKRRKRGKIRKLEEHAVMVVLSSHDNICTMIDQMMFKDMIKKIESKKPVKKLSRKRKLKKKKRTHG